MKYNKRLFHIVIGLDIALLLCVLYFLTSSRYMDRFLPNTYINDIDVSELSADEAQDKIADTYDNYTLTVTFADSQTQTLTAEDIAYHYDPDGEITGLLKTQNPLSLIITELRHDNLKAVCNSTYDPDMLTKAVKSWSQMKKKNMVKPVNAHLVYEDGSFTIAPEEAGTYLRRKKAIAAIEEAVASDSTSLDLTAIDGIYKKPSVFADDDSLKEECSRLNDLFKGYGSVTYTLPDGSEKTVDAMVMKDWLSQDDDGNYSVDDDKWDRSLKEYVSELAKDTDTVNKDHTFKTHAGKKISVRGTGYYGWKINQQDEAEQLKSDIQSGKNVTREPVYSMREAAKSSNNYGFGKTYVEVDLTDQHLWLYKKGKVIVETDVVSGTNDGEHTTPAGAYYIINKMRDTTLTGPMAGDGEYEWESEVSYWMQITDNGVGLHDADWRSEFGGDIWQWGGSHGCINLPVSKAPEIYENVDYSTPVIVYY